MSWAVGASVPGVKLSNGRLPKWPPIKRCKVLVFFEHTGRIRNVARKYIHFRHLL